MENEITDLAEKSNEPLIFKNKMFVYFSGASNPGKDQNHTTYTKKIHVQKTYTCNHVTCTPKSITYIYDQGITMGNTLLH